jgi:hypothetical protein
MHRTGTSLIAVGVVAGVLAASAARQPADAERVLAAAREALGGDAALAAVKSFSVSGSLMMNIGSRTLDQALNIDCELPDKFVREQTIRSQGPGVIIEVTHRDGFNGDELITETIRRDPLGLPMPPDINPPRTPEQIAEGRRRQVLSNKHDFAKLALVLFAGSFSSYPLEFTYAGQLPMEHGAVADVVEVKGRDGFAFRLFVDVMTHLPTMISWRQAPMVIATQSSVVTVSRGPGGAPIKPPPSPAMPPPAPPEKAPPGGIVYSGVIPAGDPTAGLPLVEHQLSLGDYRTSDGLTWPHRLMDRVEGQVAEDVKLGKFRLNPKLNSRTFNPSK